MPFRDYDSQNCSIARTLAVVGERWTLLILREVLLGRRRYEDIRRNTGVATNILSDRLDTLVEHGVLSRRGQDYVPTERGIELNPVLVTLARWGDRHLAGDAGPPRVFVHDACGHDADPELHCSHCGERVDPRELSVRPGPGADADQLAAGVLPTR
jgi:DNA-binding HxlR family transcriptional regulator